MQGIVYLSRFAKYFLNTCNIYMMMPFTVIHSIKCKLICIVHLYENIKIIMCINSIHIEIRVACF